MTSPSRDPPVPVSEGGCFCVWPHGGSTVLRPGGASWRDPVLDGGLGSRGTRTRRRSVPAHLRSSDRIQLENIVIGYWTRSKEEVGSKVKGRTFEDFGQERAAAPLHRRAELFVLGWQVLVGLQGLQVPGLVLSVCG